mgnify:CR=1 FL=1|jgi:hypothetical protein
MFKNIVDVRLNKSNLILCMPKSFVADWNENTWYDGKYFYIKRNISKKTRRRIVFVDSMLKKACEKMGDDYEIDNTTTNLKLDRI